MSGNNLASPPPRTWPDTSCPTYRQAYGRINALVIVGEGLADRHFRLLARAIPEDGDLLRQLAAMEGRHARDFVGCGTHLGIRPTIDLARRLFAPLHALFLACDRAGDLAGCITLQGLIVECFAMAAYQTYLPVADAYATPITAAVLADEAQHLDYGEYWLRSRFPAAKTGVEAVSRLALPITLRILETVRADLAAIGIEPAVLVAEFVVLFQEALGRIGFDPAGARRLLAGALVQG
jgi:fatty aldehyde decarbonylase